MAQEAQTVAGAENGSEATPVVFSAIKPWLVVEAPKANDAVQFYKAALGAEEVSHVNHPKRKAEQELPLDLPSQPPITTPATTICPTTTNLVDLHNRSPIAVVIGESYCFNAGVNFYTLRGSRKTRWLETSSFFHGPALYFIDSMVVLQLPDK